MAIYELFNQYTKTGPNHFHVKSINCIHFFGCLNHTSSCEKNPILSINQAQYCNWMMRYINPCKTVKK